LPFLPNTHSLFRFFIYCFALLDQAGRRGGGRDAERRRRLAMQAALRGGHSRDFERYEQRMRSQRARVGDGDDSDNDTDNDDGNGVGGKRKTKGSARGGDGARTTGGSRPRKSTTMSLF
jgi:hypothetical protein